MPNAHATSTSYRLFAQGMAVALVFVGLGCTKAGQQPNSPVSGNGAAIIDGTGSSAADAVRMPTLSAEQRSSFDAAPVVTVAPAPAASQTPDPPVFDSFFSLESTSSVDAEAQVEMGKDSRAARVSGFVRLPENTTPGEYSAWLYRTSDSSKVLLGTLEKFEEEEGWLVQFSSTDLDLLTYDVLVVANTADPKAHVLEGFANRE